MEGLANWVRADGGQPRVQAKGRLSWASLSLLSSLYRAWCLVVRLSTARTNVSLTISLIPKQAFWDFWLLVEGPKLLHQVQEHFMESFHPEGH